MKNFLLMLIFGLFLYSTLASNNNDDLKTVQSGISDPGSGAHTRQNKSLSAQCYGEWVILLSQHGKVTIYNPRSYEEKIGYYSPELDLVNIAIVNSEFYAINKWNGSIKSTSIDQIISPSIGENGNPDIKWKHVSSFLAARASLHRVAVNGSTMYFMTREGIFYSYNTASRKLDYRFSLPGVVDHISLLMFDDLLYIYRNHSFYTYDGLLPKKLETPGLIFPAQITPTIFLDMFIFRGTICTVGWDGVQNKLGKYPVYCWDPRKENSKWEILNYSYEARKRPAAVTTSLGSFVVGGATFPIGQPWKLIKSIETLDLNTLRWSFVPSTPSMVVDYYAAVSFNCDRRISRDN